MSELRQQLIALVRERGYEHRSEAFQLSSGEWSHDYIDGKRALSRGAALRTASEVVLEIAGELGIGFDAVGGLTMGSDPLAHGIAVLGDKEWFSVRKQTKAHGKQKLIEGAELTPEHRVLVVEDIVTTGGSIIQALEAIDAVGAAVVLAVTLVDRGDQARAYFAGRGTPYEPVATYKDLGIQPVGGPAVGATAG